ncbi:MAG: phosphoribosyltransferase [Archaeoglobaceae archaeon]|nr:phosphoribosyltransferase [Archaeoglobaceae archaeon]MDW7990075.1 phosphoribosyltransferase [Archaeoglobaceae archaeon]
MFKCHLYTWKDIENLCIKLAEIIKSSGFQVDAIVAIARGGWVPARILADLLGVKELYSVKTEHWGIVATITGKAKITQPLSVTLDGKNVLIVDDVADTGETIKIVKDHVTSLKAKDVRTAVLDYKKTSTFVPDYFAIEMDSWKWIIYPWSIREDLKGLITKKGIKSFDEAIKALKEFDIEIDNDIVREIIEG